MIRSLSLAAFALTLGCASTSAKPAFRDAAGLVDGRTSATIAWRTGGSEDAAVDARVKKLLSSQLSVEAAIQIALLENRSLQAMYEELGVAQADLVQAGLLKNPVLSGTLRFPLDPGASTGFEASLVEDFVQLLTMSARKKVARAQVEATTYRVASAVVEHAFEVKRAYFVLQAAMQVREMRAIVVEAADAAAALSEKQEAAGNVDDLDVANQTAVATQAAVDLAKSDGEVVGAREKLNRLMGLWGPTTKWTIASKLPELPPEDPPATHLESLAIERRLDVRAAEKDVEVLTYGLALAKDSRWFGGIDAGISYEKHPEGYRLIGPTVSLELPIFDQRQAAIARIEAQLRQAKAREHALAVDVRSEVREARASLSTSRVVVDTYRKKLVPLREKAVKLSQQYYDAMLLGAYQLLSAKQAEVEAWRGLVEAVRDYWVARVDLERATGGNLPFQPASGEKK